jgi:hypothetical protein
VRRLPKEKMLDKDMKDLIETKLSEINCSLNEILLLIRTHQIPVPFALLTYLSEIERSGARYCAQEAVTTCSDSGVVFNNSGTLIDINP